MANVKIHLPGVLRPMVGNAAVIDLAGADVGAALAALVSLHPALARYVSPVEGKLPNYVRVFVGGKDIRTLAGLATKLADEDVIRVIPAIAGGASSSLLARGGKYHTGRNK